MKTKTELTGPEITALFHGSSWPIQGVWKEDDELVMGIRNVLDVYKKLDSAGRAEAALSRTNLIEAMTQRFLGWPIPKGFSPDNGISFTPMVNNAPREHGSPWWPIGTNLFSADQAKQMFNACLPPEILPVAAPEPDGEPRLPCDLVVGAGTFKKGVPVKTAQGAIDRMFEHLRELEPPLTPEARGAWKEMTGIEPPLHPAEERAALIYALEELVMLKDMKDRLENLHNSGHGTDYGIYHRRKPLAWAAARKLLASIHPVADNREGTEGGPT